MTNIWEHKDNSRNQAFVGEMKGQRNLYFNTRNLGSFHTYCLGRLVSIWVHLFSCYIR